MRRLALLAGLLLVGCGGPSEPGGPSLTGYWVGQVSYGSEQVTVALTLVESQGQIAGGGELAFVGTTATFPLRVVSGLRDRLVLSITMVISEFWVVQARGSVAEKGDTMDLTLHGAGFAGERLVLQRTEGGK